MSSPGMYFDPFIYVMTTDWLIQYASMARINPKILEMFKERDQEYDLIPVPKAMFAKLQSEAGPASEQLQRYGTLGLDKPFFSWPERKDMVAGIIAEAHPGKRFADQEIMRSYEPLSDITRSFGLALEAGDVAGAMKLVSEGYFDSDGRNKATLGEELKKLVSTLGKIRIILCHAQDMQSVGNKILANITGAFDAESEGKFISDEIKMEVIFERDKNDKWKISSIKMI